MGIKWSFIGGQKFTGRPKQLVGAGGALKRYSPRRS